MATETHTVALDPVLDIQNPGQEAIASYVGVGVLIYILLLYALAPGLSSPKRHRPFF